MACPQGRVNRTHVGAIAQAPAMKLHACATRTLQFADALFSADVASLGPKGLSSERIIPAGFSVRAAVPVITTSLQGSGNDGLSALLLQPCNDDCVCCPCRLLESAGRGLATNRMPSTRWIPLHHSVISGCTVARPALAAEPQGVCSPALRAAACIETRSLVSLEQPLVGGGKRVLVAFSADEQSDGRDTQPVVTHGELADVLTK